MAIITMSPPSFPSFSDIKGQSLAEILKLKPRAQQPQDGTCTKTPSCASSTTSFSSTRSRTSSLVSRAPSYDEITPIKYINAAAFDGGGVRGASTAKIMSIIMDDLAAATGKEEHVADHFDMLAGTSTGGLIAIMLGRLRVSTSTLLETYAELSTRLFGSRGKLLRSIFRGCKYSASLAEKLFSQIVSDFSDDGPDTLLYDQNTDGGNRDCDVFVTAVRVEDTTGEPLLLRSYSVEDGLDLDHRIADAARATTAAPSYFPAKTLESGEVVVDGGVRFNNPTELLIREARKKHGHGVRFGLLLSVGTGEKAPVVLKKCSSAMSIVSLTKTMGRMLTDSEQVHMRVEARFEETELGTYLRLNVPAIGDVDMDDYKSVPDMMRATEEFMNTPEMLAVRRDVVEVLLRNRKDNP